MKISMFRAFLLVGAIGGFGMATVHANETAADSTPAVADVELRKDKSVWGFYLGFPRALFAKIPLDANGVPDVEAPPSAEDLTAPRMTTYLVGMTVPEAPIGPPRLIPNPNGGQAWLPPHQLVMDRLVTAEQPHMAQGVFVMPGPKADAGNVKTDVMMENAIVPRPLATQLKMGELWLPLTSHLTILYGVKKGLLSLQPFMDGHLQWSGPVEGGEDDVLADLLRQTAVKSIAAPEQGQ